MLNLEELSFLRDIANKYKILELHDFIKEQEIKRKNIEKNRYKGIKEKRKNDKLYARGNKRVQEYISGKHKKIIKRIKAKDIEKAKKIFEETTKVLSIHNQKTLYDFLNMFTDEEIKEIK